MFEYEKPTSVLKDMLRFFVPFLETVGKGSTHADIEKDVTLKRKNNRRF